MNNRPASPSKTEETASVFYVQAQGASECWELWQMIQGLKRTELSLTSERSCHQLPY